MFCISQVNEVRAITFSFEEPTRFQNEEWSVIIEKSTTGVTKSLKFIPNSTDIIAHGYTGGLLDEDCYISRMTEDGAVLWISSINTTNVDLEILSLTSGEVIAFTNDLSNVLILVRSYESGVGSQLLVYEFALEDGKFIEKYLIYDKNFGNSVNVYGNIVADPIDDNKFYFSISNYTSGSEYDFSLSAWDKSTNGFIWEIEVNDYYIGHCFKMCYWPTMDKIVALVVAESGLGSQYTYMYLFPIDEIITNPQIEPIDASVEYCQTFIDFDIYEDNIYILTVNGSQNALMYEEDWYITIWDTEINRDYEMIIPAIHSASELSEINVVDGSRLIISGYSYFDYFRNDEVSKELFLSYYEFNEGKSELNSIAMARFGSSDVTSWWYSTISNAKGETYCAGSSEYSGGGNYVNIISKFQNIYTSLNISDTPADNDPEDFLNRFLQQDWLISGIMASFGLIIGGLLISLIKRKK